MKTIKFASVIVALLSFSSGVLAAGLHLYSAQTQVDNDTAEVRSAGLAQDLKEVMVRLSGNADVANMAGAAGVISQAGNLVQEYRYQAIPGDDSDKRMLWARFDKGGVDRALRAAGIPVWGSLRPRVLVWIAVQQPDGTRSMLSYDTDPDASQALDSEADARGMPLQLPLMDLQDQSAISAADVWSDNQAAIRQASQRYPHDAILTGSLTAVGTDQWQGSWHLIEPRQEQSFVVPSQAWPQALQAGIDGAQDRLATQYVPAPGGAGPVLVKVRFTGIDSLHDYGWLMRLLEHQESIGRVTIVEVDADGLTTNIWVRGGSDTLKHVLPLGGNLALQPPAAPAQPMASVPTQAQTPMQPGTPTPASVQVANPSGGAQATPATATPVPGTAPVSQGTSPGQPQAQQHQPTATPSDLTFIYSPGGH